MSNDLQAQISTRIGNTVSEIGKVNAAVTQLHSSTDKNNQAHKRFQESASNAFRSTHRHASALSDKMREVGHSMGLLGGEAGHLGHALASVGRLSAAGGLAIGALAGAASVAAFAFKAYTAMAERNAEKIRDAAKAEEEYREAVLKGQDARAKGANDGLSGSQTVRGLLGAGGPQALKSADDIASRDHIDLEDARKGVLKSYHIKDEKTREASLKAASLFYQTGQGSFEEGVESGVSNPQVRGALRGGNVQRAAALEWEKAKTGRFQGGDINGMNAAIANNANDSLVAAKRNQVDDDNNTKRNQENSARSNEAQSASKAKLSESADPALKILTDTVAGHQKLIAVQEKLAEQQSGLMQALSNFMFSVGGSSEGSEVHKLKKMRNKFSEEDAILADYTMSTSHAAQHLAGRSVQQKQ